jgi:hypothetical protein
LRWILARPGALRSRLTLVLNRPADLVEDLRRDVVHPVVALRLLGRLVQDLFLRVACHLEIKFWHYITTLQNFLPSSAPSGWGRECSAGVGEVNCVGRPGVVAEPLRSATPARVGPCGGHSVSALMPRELEKP